MKQHRTGIRDASFALSILVLTLALYWPALRVFFSLDDFQFMLRAAGLEGYPESLRRLLSTRLYFIAAWRLFGTSPWPYHLVVLAIHAVNGWLVCLLSLRLGLQRSSAAIASMLFIAAPVAFLPMHWISGIQEVSVTLFALIAAYSFLGRGAASLAISFVAVGLALLCKETSLLLMPALAVALPGPNRRKWILGMGGLLFGVGLLWAVGAFAPRSAGDPYESAFGVNILSNLLTYSAWIVRFWDYFPDRLPQYQPGLAAWGLILPALLGLVAWRYPKSRLPIGRASILFLCLLLPVLPLIRHSYYYYLYLPLVPFWLLAGAGIGRLSRRPVQIGILALFMLDAAVFGIRHRGAELREGLLEDPILRYAASARDFIGGFRDTGMTGQDDHLILLRLSDSSVDVTGGRELQAREKRAQFWVVEKALLEGRALSLFFPAMRTVCFESTSTPEYYTGWQNMHIYMAYGPGQIQYFGFGENGRFRLVESAMANGKYEAAKREVGIMLELRPDNPPLNYILGHIALEQGDETTLREILEKLRSMAGRDPVPNEAGRALEALERRIAESKTD